MKYAVTSMKKKLMRTNCELKNGHPHSRIMGGVKKKKKKEMKYTEKLGKKSCLARTAAIPGWLRGL